MSHAKVDMRDAFFDGVYDLAAKDKDLIVLSADHGAFSLNQFKRDFPAQYFNVGIAEQNMVSVAAGLALGGKRVVIYSIVNFVTLRCFEQISIDLGSMKLPVTIVGVGAGFTYSTDGPTHHGVMDVAAMASVPNLTIYNCSDAFNSRAFADIAYAARSPVYVRIEKGVFADLYGDGRDSFDEGFAVLKDGRDIMIVASGYLAHTALAAAKALEAHHIDAGVIDLYRIKPLNSVHLANSVDNSRALLTLEDSVATGGIGSMVATAMMENRVFLPMRRVSLGDAFHYRYGDREWMYAQANLDMKSVVQFARELVGERDASRGGRQGTGRM
jgi:transketolase